jgi:hypothetical protein
VAVAVAVVVAVAYAVGASFTRPFTVAADVVTAVPLALAALVTIRVVGTGGGSSDRATAAGVEPIRRGRWWVAWMVPIAAVVAWELFCLVSLPRTEHPTLSSLIDTFDSSRPGKTVAFALWLALGWFLVAR